MFEFDCDERANGPAKSTTGICANAVEMRSYLAPLLEMIIEDISVQGVRSHMVQFFGRNPSEGFYNFVDDFEAEINQASHLVAGQNWTETETRSYFRRLLTQQNSR